MNQPLVSVIIPAWNARAFLKQAIDSALQQQNLELEVIVADDHSLDSLDDLVASYGDRRVTYLRLPENRGPGGARNAALDKALGRWIAVLDADDLFKAGRLEALIKIAEAKGADIAADDLVRIAIDQQISSDLCPPKSSDDDVQVIDYATFASENRIFQKKPLLGYLKPIFRRTSLDRWRLRYDESLRIGEDYQIVAEALLQGAKYIHVPTAGYVYRSRAESISHRLQPGELLAILDAEQKTLERFSHAFAPKEHAAFKARWDSLKNALTYIEAIEALKSGRVGAALALARARPAALSLFSMPLTARLQRLRSGLI